ncbi:hypothetical protein BT96DRAFT_1005290 [Gymnopus androsaceus JB14]|uniref:Uncharacterized protein n=1 Tax=Gymnopus androsaceus JB14 TaxID=1447944 RepID=A0A6A4GPV8_9AGAR|nr:hypothetical protein BT96DRAFT_1005290 [Gymnopus androsaceus JB14]
MVQEDMFESFDIGIDANGLSYCKACIVKFPDSKVHLDGLPPKCYLIEPTTWSWTTIVDLPGRGATKVKIYRSQLPIQLGFCVTGHSAQGQMLPVVLCDLKGGSWAAYVAASRARSRHGLFIVEPVTLADLNSSTLPWELQSENLRFEILEHNTRVTWSFLPGLCKPLPDSEANAFQLFRQRTNQGNTLKRIELLLLPGPSPRLTLQSPLTIQCSNRTALFPAMNVDNLFLDPEDTGSIAELSVVEGSARDTVAIEDNSDEENSGQPSEGEGGHASEDDTLSVDESDSVEAAFLKTEAKVLGTPRYESGPMVLRSTAVIGELAHHDKFDLNKVGPYLDMLYSQNGQETLNIDAMKRGKARLVLRTLSMPEDATEEGSGSDPQDAQSERDANYYPKGVSGSSWIYQGQDYYGMSFSTPPVFANVLTGKTGPGPIPRLQGNYLAPLNHIQDENKRRNREALIPTDENSNNHYLGNVRVREPDVFDSQGACIHPADYSQHLVPGVHVAVVAEHKLWDITSQRNGGPVMNPSRHCVAVAEQIHAHNRIEAARLREQERLTEEKREASKAKEAARIKAADVKAEDAAMRKRDREERLKSMWQAMASTPSTSASPSTPSSSSTVPTSSPAFSSSTPSPLKRPAAEDPPVSASPSKHRPTACMTTGGKPPRKVGPSTPSAKAGRSTRSKGKGKAIEVDAMEIDA